MNEYEFLVATLIENTKSRVRQFFVRLAIDVRMFYDVILLYRHKIALFWCLQCGVPTANTIWQGESWCTPF